MTELKCEDLVVKNKEERIDTLRSMWKAYCDGEEYTEDGESLYEYGLGFDYVEPHTFCDCDPHLIDFPAPSTMTVCEETDGYWRYQLSWGGPSDEFRYHDDGSIEYRYHDWFDGAGRTLMGTDYDFMLELGETFFGLKHQRGKYIQEWE
jgi:hypothetical protein